MSPAATTNLGYTPPDGGWGWAVVFGAFISIGFSYAFPKSLTIYFKEIQMYFSVSYSEIAWVSSIMLAAMYAGGPVSSILVNRYGCRTVVIIGGLMVGASMVAASFGTTIIHLYLLVGVIGGFGLSFNLQPSLTIIGKYFQVKRPIANGLAMAGSPVFLSTLAPLNQFLFDNFGWRGAFMILGAIVMNCCVAGALMRPVNMKTVQKHPVTASKGTTAKKAGSTENNANPEAGDLLTETEQKQKIGGCADKLMDLSLFKHRGFIIYLIGNVVMFFGFFAPVVFLPSYAKGIGIDNYQAAFLLSIFAFVDMFARPGTGLIANTKWIRPRIQYFFSFSVAYNGVCHLLCPFLAVYLGYAGLVVYAVFFGVAFGMVCALLFEVLMDLVGAQRFSSAVGLVTILECGPVLLGPPISGFLVDVFDDHKYMYWACGAMMLAPGIFLFIMNYFNYKQLDQEERERQSGAIGMQSVKQSVAEEEEARKKEMKMTKDEEMAEGTGD
ncbi:monocarboxylate transporter 2-like [Oncorhynchus clarkii lewisi]|uniref:monocarboxylate transporter 2-like n=1 Tax=Oncorhynchus clarkii lewisi TaxID=490388 RepID=UPI0039B8E296